MAACALSPGDYFSINCDKAKYAQTAPKVLAENNWDIKPVELRALEAGVKEKGLFEGRGPIAILLLVLIGGLALNLTPCVLPMIPINLAIIGAGNVGTAVFQRGFQLLHEQAFAADRGERAILNGITLEVMVDTGREGGVKDPEVLRQLEKLETFLESRKKLDLLEEIRRISNLIQVSYVRQGEALGLRLGLHRKLKVHSRKDGSHDIRNAPGRRGRRRRRRLPWVRG